MSATGKPLAATCSRMSALMPPPGVEMMIAPALGPDPACVRMSPITSSTRSASRTLERPTPSSDEQGPLAGQAVAGGAARRSAAGTRRVEYGAPGAGGVGCRCEAASGAVASPAMPFDPSPSSCGLTTLADVVRPHEQTREEGRTDRGAGASRHDDRAPSERSLVQAAVGLGRLVEREHLGLHVHEAAARQLEDLEQLGTRPPVRRTHRRVVRSGEHAARQRARADSDEHLIALDRDHRVPGVERRLVGHEVEHGRCPLAAREFLAPGQRIRRRMEDMVRTDLGRELQLVDAHVERDDRRGRERRRIWMATCPSPPAPMTTAVEPGTRLPPAILIA